MASGLAFGFALGFMRMGQGAHFLSDVIFSFVANGLVFAALYGLILKKR